MNTQLLTSNIPSNLSELLDNLVGLKLERLVRFSWYPVDEAVNEYEIKEDDVFSLTAGPLLMYFATGLVVGATSNPSDNSVVLWVEKNEVGDSVSEPTDSDEELFPIDAKNSHLWCDFIGKEITSFSIIHRKPRNALLAELPNEVGLLVSMVDGSEFILSHGLHDDSDDFSVISREQVSGELLNQLENI